MRRSHRRLLIGIAACGPALAGCPLLPGTAPGLNAFPAGDSRLVLTERALFDAPPPDDAQPPAERSVQELDLHSGALLTVLADVAAYPGDVVANDRWIAWIDRAADTIQVFDRATQQARALYDGRTAPQPNPAESAGRLLTVRGDRLIAFVPAAQTQRAGSDACYSFVVFELRTGGVTVVEGAWVYATFGVEGEWLAFYDCGPSDAELRGLELRTNLQLANLATGAVRAIAPGIRVDGTGAGRIIVAGGVVYWEEFYAGSFRSRVRAYDSARGRLSEVFDDFSRRVVDRELLAARNDLAIVLTRPNGVNDFGRPARVEVWGFDGSRTTLFESVALRLDFDFRAWLVGDRITWFDPDVAGRRIVIHDLRTGETRRVALD